jgi:maltose alpha-D-glucosyltransferase / alpha-amylase
MARRPRYSLGPDPVWYKDAVIYQLHVKSFFDGNNDGIGDFAGLVTKLDYLAELGVNAVWLLPFYPSPLRDDGYDIADYKSVNPHYGTIGEVRRFVEEAHARKIRVITELVVNHTSDQHPWFQRARHAKSGSSARNFYVWSDDDKRYADTRIIFCDTEKSNWTWDDVAQAYYWHRFYAHQPDLNFDNPRVLLAVLEVLRFWFDLGVDGLRLDAVPYLVEREGTNNENLPETHAILKRIRAEVDAHYKDRMLLAEANQWPEDVQQYFGSGDECQMLFHFPLMPRMYMAIAQEDRFPITDIMRQTPDIPPECQWAIFLRNHDELTLEMVTDKERDYLWSFYAADSRARLNLGIRRRLAPLLQHDRRRIELMNSLLLTMRGTPVIYYGDEIGMGDNIHLGDRDGVRTPMQWTPDRNGGFSRADPAALVLPVIMDPIYGYEAVNVEAQLRDPPSLLNWMRRMLVVRGEHKAFGRGGLRFLRPHNRKVLPYLREYEGETILCVVNVSRAAQAVELDLAEFAGRTPVEMLGGTGFPTIGQLPYLLTLPPYGFYWFLLSEEGKGPSWGVQPAAGATPELYTFVLRDGLKDTIEGTSRSVLEREILPKYVAERRWFQSKNEEIKTTEVVAVAAAGQADKDFVFADIEIVTTGGRSTYSFPMAIAWEDVAPAPLETPFAFARARRRSRVGVVTDGFASMKYVRAVVEGLQAGARLPFGDGELVFRPVAGSDVALSPDSQPEWPSTEQTNSSLIIDRQAIVKLFRRAIAGPHPEAEMVRELTQRGFTGIAPLLGDAVRVHADGTESAMLIVQRFIFNQGDGFRWTIDQLNRLADEGSLTPQSEQARSQPHLNFVERLGYRLGEMHAVLARPSDIPAFAPAAADEGTVKAWREHAAHEIGRAFDALAKCKPDDEQWAPLAQRREKIRTRVDAVLRRATETVMTRIHGDLHLGQVLVAAGDVIFIDFEGEPSAPIAARRAKMSPLRDVAGMLRSFDYATRIVERDNRTLKEGSVSTFRQIAETVFLAAYGQGRGTALTKEERELLTAFALERAAYEILYEAANRPDWINLPLAGFAELADRLLGGQA